MDSGDRQAHHGTEVEPQTRSGWWCDPGPHTCIVWTRTQPEKITSPCLLRKNSTPQRPAPVNALVYFAGKCAPAFFKAFRNSGMAASSPVVAALLYVSDRWTEEGRTVFLGDGEQN